MMLFSAHPWAVCVVFLNGVLLSSNCVAGIAGGEPLLYLVEVPNVLWSGVGFSCPNASGKAESVIPLYASEMQFPHIVTFLRTGTQPLQITYDLVDAYGKVVAPSKVVDLPGEAQIDSGVATAAAATAAAAAVTPPVPAAAAAVTPTVPTVGRRLSARRRASSSRRRASSSPRRRASSSPRRRAASNPRRRAASSSSPRRRTASSSARRRATPADSSPRRRATGPLRRRAVASAARRRGVAAPAGARRRYGGAPINGKQDRWQNSQGNSYGYANGGRYQQNYPSGSMTNQNGHSGRSSIGPGTAMAMGAVGGAALGVGGMYAYSRYNRMDCTSGSWSGSCSECSRVYSSAQCNSEYSFPSRPLRDDMMTEGFIPQDFTQPITVRVTRVMGADYPPATACSLSPNVTFPDVFVQLTKLDMLQDSVTEEDSVPGDEAHASLETVAWVLIFVLCCGCCCCVGVALWCCSGGDEKRNRGNRRDDDDGDGSERGRLSDNNWSNDDYDSD